MKMGRNVKDLLRRVPGLVAARRFVMYWWPIARHALCEDGETMNDLSHLRRDWDFESPAEQERHELILSAVKRQYPDLPGARVLELGCSDGVFSARLARRCGSVTACDISSVGLELAAKRCRSYNNMTFRKLDIARDVMPARYDIVFAMDVLEFIHGRRHLQRVVRRLGDAVYPQGLLVISDCRLPPVLRKAWWQSRLPEGGDAIVRLTAADPTLRLLHSEFHPKLGVHFEGYAEHVVAMFRKVEPDQRTNGLA